ncbi:MAG: hypothetical protein AAGC77_05640 [Pseudomonadota bacterium]
MALLLIVGCVSSRGVKIDDVSFDPDKESLILLETSSRIQGFLGTDFLTLQQFDLETGESVGAATSGQFRLSGTGGRFAVAKVQAGFHVIRSYEGVNGLLCYDLGSVGIDVKPGSVVFMGTLDARETQRDASTAALSFVRRTPFSTNSPLSRDYIVFSLTGTSPRPIDTVTMKREFYGRAEELPFAAYADAEHTHRVVTKLFITSLAGPRIAMPTRTGLEAANLYLKEKRPDIRPDVSLGAPVYVKPHLTEKTCVATMLALMEKE